jgi:hypothetical protein
MKINFMVWKQGQEGSIGGTSTIHCQFRVIGQANPRKE